MEYVNEEELRKFERFSDRFNNFESQLSENHDWTSMLKLKQDFFILTLDSSQYLSELDPLSKIELALDFLQDLDFDGLKYLKIKIKNQKSIPLEEMRYLRIPSLLRSLKNIKEIRIYEENISSCFNPFTFNLFSSFYHIKEGFEYFYRLKYRSIMLKSGSEYKKGILDSYIFLFDTSIEISPESSLEDISELLKLAFTHQSAHPVNIENKTTKKSDDFKDQIVKIERKKEYFDKNIQIIMRSRERNTLKQLFSLYNYFKILEATNNENLLEISLQFDNLDRSNESISNDDQTKLLELLKLSIFKKIIMKNFITKAQYIQELFSILMLPKCIELQFLVSEQIEQQLSSFDEYLCVNSNIDSLIVSNVVSLHNFQYFFSLSKKLPKLKKLTLNYEISEKNFFNCEVFNEIFELISQLDYFRLSKEMCWESNSLMIKDWNYYNYPIKELEVIESRLFVLKKPLNLSVQLPFYYLNSKVEKPFIKFCHSLISNPNLVKITFFPDKVIPKINPILQERWSLFLSITAFDSLLRKEMVFHPQIILLDLFGFDS